MLRVVSGKPVQYLLGAFLEKVFELAHVGGSFGGLKVWKRLKNQVLALKEKRVFFDDLTGDLIPV